MPRSRFVGYVEKPQLNFSKLLATTKSTPPRKWCFGLHVSINNRYALLYTVAFYLYGFFKNAAFREAGSVYYVKPGHVATANLISHPFT